LEQLAITYPEDHLFLAVDGMDNRKSDLPKFQQNAKNFVIFQKLPTHITGAIVTSGFYPEKQKTYFFLNHNQFEQGQCQILEICKNNDIYLCDPIGKQTFCMTIIIRHSGCPCIYMCDQFTYPHAINRMNIPKFNQSERSACAALWHCRNNVVSTINSVFSSSFSTPGYFSPRRGYHRIMKFCIGF
jgi:hypothetical protein